MKNVIYTLLWHLSSMLTYLKGELFNRWSVWESVEVSFNNKISKAVNKLNWAVMTWVAYISPVCRDLDHNFEQMWGMVNLEGRCLQWWTVNNITIFVSTKFTIHVKIQFGIPLKNSWEDTWDVRFFPMNSSLHPQTLQLKFGYHNSVINSIDIYETIGWTWGQEQMM